MERQGRGGRGEVLEGSCRAEAGVLGLGLGLGKSVSTLHEGPQPYEWQRSLNSS